MAKKFIKWKQHYLQYYPIVKEVAERHGLDPRELYKISLLESGVLGNKAFSKGKGSSGGKGLFSMTNAAMKDAKMPSDTDLFDPRANAEGAARFIKKLSNEGVPDEDLHIAFRTGKTGYKRYKQDKLGSQTLKEVNQRLRDVRIMDNEFMPGMSIPIPTVKPILNLADMPPNIPSNFKEVEGTNIIDHMPRELHPVGGPLYIGNQQLPEESGLGIWDTIQSWLPESRSK